MSQILLSKPSNIFTFAASHFADLSPESALNRNLGFPAICICGPSGVGKGTLINLLMKHYPSAFGFSVSHTTRGPRPGEVDGEHYHFKNRDEMQQAVEEEKFIEYANVHSNIYGTSFESVQAVRSAGKVCVLDIDIQGCKNLKTHASNTIPFKYLFVKPPSLEVLEDRLRERGDATSEEDIQTRLGKANEEIEYGKSEGTFDSVVTNEVLEEAFNDIRVVVEQLYPHLKTWGQEGEEKGPESEAA